MNILGTGSKAAVSVNKSTYSKVLTTAKSYSKSQTTSADKSINYLKKIGAISGSEQAKQLQKEKGSGAKRVNDIKSTISKIEKAEKNGGTDRAALVSKLNRQLLKLTDAGTNKQKRLYKDLKENVGHLTTSQYSTVMKKSRAARKQTISDAKKQYNSQTSTAFKTYKKTLKSAKQIYGVHSSMYKSIKGSADKQYDKTTSAAYRQYKKTVKYANQQAKEVVQAAANAAGGINGIMGVMSNNIDDLGKQLAKAVGGTWQKPKSNDQSFHDNTNPAGNLAKGAKKLQNKETSSVLKSGPSVKLTSSSSVFSKATGGSIFKHGMSMVGENGFELLQRGKSFKLIGRHGAQLMQVGPGDRIYKHADAVAMTKGSYGERIPGFASGNAKPKQKKKVAVPDAASVAKVNSMGGTETVVKRSMSKISKSIAKGYSSGTEKSNKSISKFKSKNSSEWKSIHKTTDKYTNQIRKGTVSDFDQMQKGSQKQMIQLHKGLNSAAKATTSDFGDIMGRLKPYAHKAMGGAITSLNGGISGINSTLSQFGGNKSVLKPIHYATGSKGPIRSDQMAVLNDAKSGPRQELVARGGQLLKPEGKDVLTPLKKGDEVLNGAQVAHARQFLPHFAKGTGVSKDKLLSLIEKNSGKPNDAWKSDFTSHLTDGSGPQLASGVQSLGTKAANSKGVPWNAAAWSVMNAAAQSGGAGGNWRHDPGMTKSNGFGASRSFGSHDGVDFTGPQGTPIKAVHGGIVTRAGKPVWDFKDLGYVVTVKSDDGWQEIYQEFGNASHIKAHVGQTIKTGDTVATQGGIIGSSTGPHVHIGVSKGSLWNHGGSSTRGWYDVTKMQGSSNGTAKAPKANTALQKFAKNQLNAAGVLPWITKNIAPLTEDDSGGGGTSAAPSGSHKHWLEQAGIPANQFGAYNAIITPESGWNPKIHNPSSSAYGLPQALPGSKMASAGSDWKTNPITQLKWMKGYVKGRYGGINQALSFRKAHGWYAKGGTPPLNSWVGVNEEGQELFKTKKSGKIVPHKESQRLVSKATGGGTKIAPQYNVKVEVNGNADDAAITAAVKRALKEHDEELIARINAQSGDDSSYEFI
ncbi:SLT domain-containing protein [Levilactobacillus senmaizukei DSM 21775 = NBRC 103853]|uniref:SLT domain-containing protein n=1 Tax=Levilactobacillus senmaizukei DSM 21775 = NBRC 103853 TaxID=1423803 RepID=A0A0R2DDW2_9LACO|nr:M23 family metallopeptidase [Levilactobacillus senmaizukei]KRN02161.1 SLT domain-containing protein [Levilactobacillus senmaizukei DSM 21775 = NBRC 103853]